MIKPASMEELHQLSERGVAVFAARYARRTLPLFQLLTPEDQNSHIRAVEYAVRLAEILNRGGSGDLRRAADSARHAGYAATDSGAKHAAIAASTACICASHVDSGYSDPDAVDNEFKKVLFDLENITDLETLSKLSDVFEAGRNDLTTLRRIKNHNWADYIDPLERVPLGLLWPGGVPNWYPADAALSR